MLLALRLRGWSHMTGGRQPPRASCGRAGAPDRPTTAAAVVDPVIAVGHGAVRDRARASAGQRTLFECQSDVKKSRSLTTAWFAGAVGSGARRAWKGLTL